MVIKSVLNKYVLNACTFKCIIVFALFILQIPFVHFVYGQNVKYLLAFGVLCLACELFKNRMHLNIDIVGKLLFLFCGLYAVSVMLNRNLYFSNNIKQLIYMVIFFCLFVVVINYSDLSNARREIKLLSWIIVFTTLILTIASLLTYFLNIYEWYANPGDLDFEYIGIREGRLFGFYNSNSCGAIALCSIITSLFILFSDGFRKSFYGICSYIILTINIAAQFIALVLSQSRSAFYSLLITLVLLIFITILKKANYKLLAKFAVAFLISIVFAISFIKISDVVLENKFVGLMVPDEVANNTSYDSFYENSIEDILKKYYEYTSANAGHIFASFTNMSGGVNSEVVRKDFTSGRTEIWNAGINVFLQNPIFGVTREGLADEVNNFLGYKSSAVVGGGLHNMYLTILVSSGIVGFITVGAAVVIVLGKFLIVLFSKRKVDNDLLFSFAMVFAFLVSELVENRILYQVTAFNVVFWIYFGYLYFFAKEALKGESDEFSSIKTE